MYNTLARRWDIIGPVPRVLALIMRPVIPENRAALPANTKRSPNIDTVLGQRRRRWANIVPTLAERLGFWISVQLHCL